MGKGRRKVLLDRMANHHSTPGSSSGLPSSLEAMLGSMLDGSDLKEPAVPLAEIWGAEINILFHMIPEDLLDQWDLVRHSFRLKIEKVFQNQEIHGSIHDLQERGDVYVSFEEIESKRPRFGCTLCNIQSDHVCVHIAGFVNFIDDQLDGRKSKLQALVDQRKFIRGKLDRSPFELDASSHFWKNFNHVVSSLPRTVDDNSLDEGLPPVDVAPEQRVCWAFDAGGQSITVNALVQQRKKRGTGFTKGRKIGMDKLINDRDLPLGEADQKIIDSVEPIQDHYYSNRYRELSPIEVARCLVEQDNVLMNGQPCTISRWTPMMRMRPTDNGSFLFQLRSCHSAEEAQTSGSYLAFGDTGILKIDEANSEICYMKSNSSSNTVIRKLLSAPPLDREKMQDVAQQITALQSFVPVLLPEEFGGPIEEDSAQPVVILRSRTDGKLDYGIRIRTKSGKLKRPGAPMIVSIEKRKGKPVQMLRDAAKEHAIASDLLNKLDMSCSDEDWMGTIDDFEIALRLIERLQSDELEVEVLWDKTSEKPIKVLGSLSSRNVKVEIASKRNWFGITGQCNFGDQSIPLSELLANLPSGDQAIGDFINLGDGGWAKINDKLRQRLKRLREATHLDRKTLKLDATAAPAISDLIADDVELRATKAWEKCLKRFSEAQSLVPEVPKNLDADLRDYQVDGYKWMSRLAAWGVGGILADDMGLGKTLQALAVLLDRAKDGPALVIAPTSVGFNWVRETERFAPDLDVQLYRETDRAEFLTTVGPGTLVVCSYGLALRDAEALASVPWSTLVLDEAQAIKNSRSKTSRAIASIDADWTVALTGTPMENHLGELWSLFQVVSPGVFGGWDQFRTRYATPIEKEHNEDARDALAIRLQPFVLRRTKSEVLTELPPRTEMNLYVDLSPAERAEYERVRLAAIGEIDQIESLAQIQDQRFKILALMTRLRQISCHAGLVNKDWVGSSAKLDQLCETLESLREEGHRALVFSQFTSHLALIRTALDDRGITYEYLDGSTPAKSRQIAVDRFQEGDANVFLISLKAGGTGLNLTAADYVIHMDPWWNPAVEDQATDRAHRYGQDKPVMVYRIVARGTIEEEILALHESKRDLVAGVMKGTQAAAKLTNDDLVRMIRG